MNKTKKLIFYIGNVLLGIISFYIYLYLWVSLSFEEPFFRPLEFILTILISGILYYILNYPLLRKENENSKYWLIGIIEVITTILLIVFIVYIS